MGLNEMLLKKTPPQYHAAEDLGALGMADGPYIHCRCMNMLSAGINAFLLAVGKDDDFEAWAEGPSEHASKNYYRYDVVLKQNVDIDENTADNILVIEVCHNGDFVSSEKKVMRSFTKYTSLEEFMIYNYDSKQWTRYYKNDSGTIVKDSNSKSHYLELDLSIYIQKAHRKRTKK